MIRATAGALILAMLALPCAARADTPFVESWRDRPVEGAFASAKSSAALQTCIAARIGSPAAPAHNEDIAAHISEIDAPSMQFGVRIVDQGDKRVLVYVAHPATRDRAAAFIKSCV